MTRYLKRAAVLIIALAAAYTAGCTAAAVAILTLDADDKEPPK